MVVKTVLQAAEMLELFRPRKKWYRRFLKRSAVALIMRDTSAGVEVLMIKRADREGDPWSGHMAFPGGRADDVDDNNLHTARRETWEEIGLDTHIHTECLGRLSDVLSQSHRGRDAMVITPYVFTMEQAPELNPNHEVAEIIWLPLSFIADTSNRQRMSWKVKKISIDLPCYFYKERRIWGLSLMMLDELTASIANEKRRQ